MTVYVATTRTPESAAPARFTAGRSDTLHYARYVVSIPPNHKPAEIEWPNGRPDPATSFATLDAAPLSEAQFRGEVARQAQGGIRPGEAAVFVHGYNYNFQESLFRAAQLSADANPGGALVLFAWPSEASPTAYVADKDASTYSRDGLTHVLAALTSEPRLPRLVVVSHSMGGWLTMEALRQLRLTGKDAAIRKLDDVILAAPDIDVDVFAKQLAVVGRLPRPLTLMVSKDDGALSLSSFLAGDRPRVGLADIEDPRVQEAARRYDVRVIDISALTTRGDLNHGRYAEVAAIYPKLIGETGPRVNPLAGVAGVFLLKLPDRADVPSVVATYPVPRT